MKNLIIVLLAAAFVFAGCGTKINGPLGPTVPSASVTSQAVTASAGGTVNAGTASVAIPAGALSADTTITIAPLTEGSLPAVPPGNNVLIAAAAFGPEGTVFTTGITITFALKTPGTPGGSMTLCLYNTATGEWDYEGSAVVSADGKSAVATVSHFSVYSVMRSTGFVTQSLVHNHPQRAVTNYSGYFDFDSGYEMPVNGPWTSGDFKFTCVGTSAEFTRGDSDAGGLQELTGTTFDEATSAPASGYANWLDYSGVDVNTLAGKIIAVETTEGAHVVLQVISFDTNPEPSWVRIKWKVVP